MKLLIITNKLGIMDGWERFSLNLSNGLANNGIEIIVICNEKNPDVLYTQYAILPSPLSLRKNYFCSWFYALKIAWLIRKEKIDVIHCFVEQYSFISYLLSFIKTKRLFIAVHGTFAVKLFSSKVYGYLQHLAYNRAKSITSCSKYTMERLSEFEKTLPIIVISHGVQEKFLKAPHAHEGERKPIILSVGELKYRKGFEYLVRAMALVRGKMKDASCIIVGSQKDKEYFNLLLELQKELHLENAITFLTNVSDEELLELYGTAKVFVMASISEGMNFEGYGLVYLEANVLGVPAIGSYESGAEEAIIHGETGYLVPQKDAETIAQKVTELLTNEDLWQRLSKNSYKHSLSLSWDNIASKYVALYNEHTL